MKSHTWRKLFILLSACALITLLLTPPLPMGATTAKVEEPPRTQASGGFRPVVLRHDPTPSTHRVAPPPQFTRGELQAAQTATINVTFMAAGSTAPLGETCLTWPNEAKAAFNYAADIWETLIVSSVPIEIDACWTQFSDPGILGYGGAWNSWANFTNAPRTNTWYPNALANSLAGTDLDTVRHDIVGAYGSTFSWYFGTDGNTPGDKVDFVSVVLHEIAHGLGFSGSMSVSSGQGSWGDYVYGMPDSYDHFTENGSGQQLLNTGIFSNPSAALAAQLTGEDIFFDGPNAVAANGGSRPELYAPSPWDQGSSYAHLDESFNGTENALMTWSLSDGESEHSPGPVALGILEDVGWTLTTVDPAPTLTSITPSSGYNSGTVSITDLAGENFQAGATVKLTRSGETDITATNVTVIDATQITCQFDLLSAATGDWNVVVTNPDSQSATLTNGFSVQPSATAPTISTITPSEGGNTQSLQITLAGTNFATSGGTPVVKLRRGSDTITGSGVNVIDSTQLNAMMDLNGATPGLWDVVVTNPNGESGILEDAFTVRSTNYYVYLPLTVRNHPVMLTNGDFERGRSDWTEYSALGYALILNSSQLPISPHGGSWATWLGGDFNETAYIEQKVTVLASTPYLTYWYVIGSLEASCNYDYGMIMIDGTVVDSYGLCDSTETTSWTKKSIDLSGYAGQTVSLRIQATTDGSFNSNLFIDDVSFASTAVTAAAQVDLVSPPTTPKH